MRAFPAFVSKSIGNASPQALGSYKRVQVGSSPSSLPLKTVRVGSPLARDDQAASSGPGDQTARDLRM